MNQIHHQAKWDSHVPGPWVTRYWIKEPHRFNKQPLVTSIHNGNPISPLKMANSTGEIAIIVSRTPWLPPGWIILLTRMG